MPLGPQSESAIGSAVLQSEKCWRVGRPSCTFAASRTNETRLTFPTRNTLFLGGLVAVAYVGAALLGLQLDAVSGFAALVWPASGIALASILLAGNRIWCGIAIGAFTANMIAGAPLLASLGIAAGNTSAALLGAAMLRRLSGFDPTLERVRDAVALIGVALVSTLLSASVGVTVLAVSGIVSDAQIGQAWRAWWVGDTIGDLVIAPVMLVWARWRALEIQRNRLLESFSLGAIVIVASLIVFGAPEFIRAREYMVFPVLMWAAIRFGVRGSVTATLTVMVVAVIRTATGHGPLIGGSLHDSLFELQAFIGISAATFLILGASISERGRAATELAVARETAEAANRAKAGFLAAVSHELRTPLNAITGYVDLLSLELDGPLTPKQHTSLGRIADSQRHLLHLIDDVLGFAQVEAGRLSLSLQPVIVSDIIGSVEPLVMPEIARKGLTFRTEPCDPSMAVRADPDKLRQVLLNLVTNATKFTSAPGTVTIGAAADDGSVRIRVSDTGIGIPADHLPSVFNPFFQVEQGATRRYPGVGLGLSIVREIVLAMEGDVSIESKVGDGTHVTITLPKSHVQRPS
jgi:signal transduction histidine kinase